MRAGIINKNVMPLRELETHHERIMKTKVLGRAPQDMKKQPVQPENEKKELSREDLRKILDRTLEIAELLNPRRHLKYEVIDEADLVQIQVINNDDGNIIKKIPADEIVELVKKIHEILSERLDVKA